MIKAIKIGFIKEAGEYLPTGELGVLAQRGVEEYEDTTNQKEYEVYIKPIRNK